METWRLIDGKIERRGNIREGRRGDEMKEGRQEDERKKGIGRE